MFCKALFYENVGKEEEEAILVTNTYFFNSLKLQHLEVFSHQVPVAGFEPLITGS
jgi:hypothetical protein